VRTLRSAAALLAAAGTLDGLTSLIAALGFAAPPAPLDDDDRGALGMAAVAEAAYVARGPGGLRALLVAVDGTGPPLRECIARIAARLSSRATHLYWLVGAIEPQGTRVALAAWSAGQVPPRTVALVVDRARVMDSDAETFCALEAAIQGNDGLTHSRWLDVLGRESLTRRFYSALEHNITVLSEAVTGCDRASLADRRALALLHASRLLFLSFLEAKGWLNGDRAFIARSFSECVAGAGRYHDRVLLPLFFGTLNTPPSRRAGTARAFGRVPFLNGGLFARTALERQHQDARFADEHLGALVGDVLGRYRFTAREDRSTWSEAAIDPEMLGKAFESLMQPRERHSSGAYYTPQTLVDHVTHEALAEALASPAATASDVAALLGGESPAARAVPALRDGVRQLRILDPACGSGAFLVYALESLANLLGRLGDSRGIAECRRAVLTRSIFGVDVNPTAVWLCELRLWLSVVIESGESDATHVTPLPNLDRHVHVGNSLSGSGFDTHWPVGVTAGVSTGRQIAGLRSRYARSVGARKRSLACMLDRAERAAAVAAIGRALARASNDRRELLTACRAADLFGSVRSPSTRTRQRLAQLRSASRELRARQQAIRAGAALPFTFDAHFADVGADGGFHIVIGNPPWVRMREIAASTRARLHHAFRVCRVATWASTVSRARNSRGFAGQVDLAAMFVERGLSLCRDRGVLALVVPAKLWHSLAGGGVRCLVRERAELLAIEDWSEGPRQFDASVYPSLILARRHVAGCGGGAANVPEHFPHKESLLCHPII
jgi:N-6 DNA Methylase